MKENKKYIGIVVGVREIITEPYLVNGTGKKKVDTRCTKCGAVRTVGPVDFVRSEGSCPDCKTGSRYNKSDLTGEGYGDFVVIGETDYSGKYPMVPLQCNGCGHKKSVSTSAVKSDMICRKCHPVNRTKVKKLELDPRKYLGQVVGFQRVVSEVIFQNTGHHRLELECTECGHRKTMAIHDLFRKRRKTGGCTVCKAGMVKPKSRVGLVFGAMEIISEQSNGHYKSKTVEAKCKFCGETETQNFVKLSRGAGKCNHCGRSDKGEIDYVNHRDFTRAFRRANPDEVCSCCGIRTWRGFKLPMQVDHIVPISQGGRSTLKNGQYLCPNCHIIKTAREHPVWELELADEVI